MALACWVSELQASSCRDPFLTFSFGRLLVPGACLFAQGCVCVSCQSSGFSALLLVRAACGQDLVPSVCWVLLSYLESQMPFGCWTACLSFWPSRLLSHAHTLDPSKLLLWCTFWGGMLFLRVLEIILPGLGGFSSLLGGDVVALVNLC